MPIQVRGVLVHAMSGTELSRVRTEFRLRLPETIDKSPLESRGADIVMQSSGFRARDHATQRGCGPRRGFGVGTFSPKFSCGWSTRRIWSYGQSSAMQMLKAVPAGGPPFRNIQPSFWYGAIPSSNILVGALLPTLA